MKCYTRPSAKRRIHLSSSTSANLSACFCHRFLPKQVVSLPWRNHGKSVSAADANRRFSELLRGVRKGRSYVVTSHGEPVAKLVPAEKDARSAAAARSVLLSRLQKQKPAKGAKARRRWTRDELYEDAK